MVESINLWKARLLPASFRGIPFGIDSHEFSGGRSKVQHEPPDRESTSAEDLGRKSQGYSIEAHVLGDNYFFLRDALVNAMEKEGAGILIHPFLGAKEVQPGEFSLRETMTEEGRIARFSLQFSEAGDPSFPFAAIDAVTDFLSNVVGLVAGVQDAFQIAYVISQLPGFALLSAESIADEFLDSVEGSIDRISGKEEDAAELRKQLNAFDSNILVRNAASMAAAVDAILERMKDLPDESEENETIDLSRGRDDKIDIFTDLVNFTPETLDTIPLVTETRQREYDNAIALQNLVRQLALIRQAENAIAKEYDSRDSAITLREEIVTAINIQQEYDIDDNLFQLFSDLKYRLTRAVPQDFLATVETHEVADTLPAIMLAYDLYESDENESDIIERNSIWNPCFISGSIEVLSG